MAEAKSKRDWWLQGKAFDLWSIPHFLFGILTAFVPPITGFSILTALSITLILALAWEVYEKFMGIKETIQNSLLDMLLPIVAFTMTSQILVHVPLHYEDTVVLALAVFVLYVYTNVSGWLAHRRRNRNFTN